MVSYVINGTRVPVGGSIDNAVMLYGVYEIVTETNLDTVLTVGNYFKELTTFSCTNAPLDASSSDVQFRLRVESRLGSDSDHLTQYLTIASSGITYRRIFENNAWGSWVDTGENIPTALTDTELVEVKSSFDLT